MLTPIYATRFDMDFKLAVRRGKDPEKIKTAIRLLCSGQPLPASYRDHPLKGRFARCRDCHIEPDLILIYAIDNGQLQLICLRLDTHSDLFGN